MVTLVQDLVRVKETSSHATPRKKFTAAHKQPVQAQAQERCVHELFAREAERSPNSIAVIFGETQLTYGELNSRANQLARFLKRFGVGPNSPVGLCVDRSPEMLVGILGILKAGAAYVPMDPYYATEKLKFIMRDANIFVLLTQSHLLEAVPRHDGPRLSLDTDWDVVAKEKLSNPARLATTKNLAYVIYTSADGGGLKGVMISHRGLVNYLNWGAEAYEVVKGCGSIVDAAVPFDLAITRVLAPLMVGRSVIFVEENSFANC
jgi:non-ribosomal peptide synthetase component F